MNQCWICVCGTENAGAFCTECGLRRGEIWSSLRMARDNKTCFDIELKKDRRGSMILRGSCTDIKGNITEEAEGFPLHGDILCELRELNLDAFPVHAGSEADRKECVPILGYPNGKNVEKDVPEEICKKIGTLLTGEIRKKAAADEKRRREFAAPEYAIFAAIREDNLEKVTAAIRENPETVNAVAPKNPYDTRAMSPLQVSLCTGRHREIARFLLENGADVNYRADRKLYSDARPVLFDAVDSALWNSRRYAWDGEPCPPLNLVWKHTAGEADETFDFLKRMVELGADVNKTDFDGRNALFEAVAEASVLCPDSENDGVFDPPGKPMTDEMRDDFRRVIGFLIEAGADTNAKSAFLKKTVRGYFSDKYIWKICGDLFDGR